MLRHFRFRSHTSGEFDKTFAFFTFFPCLPPEYWFPGEEGRKKLFPAKSGWDLRRKSIGVEGLWNLFFLLPPPAFFGLFKRRNFRPEKWQIGAGKERKCLYVLILISTQRQREGGKSLKFHFSETSERYQRRIRNEKRRRWKEGKISKKKSSKELPGIENAKKKFQLGESCCFFISSRFFSINKKRRWRKCWARHERGCCESRFWVFFVSRLCSRDDRAESCCGSCDDEEESFRDDADGGETCVVEHELRLEVASRFHRSKLWTLLIDSCL